MRVELRLGGLIRLNGRDIALGQSFALLDALAGTRSVRGASQRLKLSYRAAWGRIQLLEQAFARALVVKTKGHGTVLTPDGEALRLAFGAVIRDFERPLAVAETALTARLQALVAAVTPRLQLAVSHDPLLADLLATLPDAEVTVAGSTEAAMRLLAGTADAAGVHCGAGPLPGAGPIAEIAADAAFTLTPLFRREQGLLLAPGNPLGIVGVADLAGKRARFVNRQKGSGTRQWFDRLLAEAGLAAGDIAGYGQEEHTHQAVAAIVASGAADAAMGVRAVAERFGLAFLSLGEELYYLGVRRGPAERRVEPIIALAAAARAHAAGYSAP